MTTLIQSTIPADVKAYVRNNPVAVLCITNFIYSGHDLSKLTVGELESVKNASVEKLHAFEQEVPQPDAPTEVLNGYYHNCIAKEIASDEFAIPFKSETFAGMIDELVDRVATSPRVGMYYNILTNSDPASVKFFDDVKAAIIE